MRCAVDRTMAAEELTATLQKYAYAGSALTSGAHVYRVVYSTTRGTVPPSDGYSSALVFLPTVRRAERLPVIVVGHGSRGQAPHCAPSVGDPTNVDTEDDLALLVLPLVGHGFAVVVPDLAGYANYGGAGNPPSGYASASDVARSIIDGARALTAIVPSSLTDDIVLIGHSQGGFTVLSALAYLDAYGSNLNVAGAVLVAPLWLTQRTWGAILALPSVYTTRDYPAPSAISLWYHYTTAELLDGPGGGLALFRPEAQPAVQRFIDTRCWGSDTWNYLRGMTDSVASLFDPAFVSAVGMAAAGFSMCPQDPTLRATCERWMGRYAADRPHLAGSALDVPLLIVWGGQDDTLPADRISCALDRLRADGATIAGGCIDPAAGHAEVLASTSDHWVGWIASKTLGEPPPAACPADLSFITATCNPVPPND